VRLLSRLRYRLRRDRFLLGCHGPDSEINPEGVMRAARLTEEA